VVVITEALATSSRDSTFEFPFLSVVKRGSSLILLMNTCFNVLSSTCAPGTVALKEYFLPTFVIVAFTSDTEIPVLEAILFL